MLELASAEFDAFVTADLGIQYQQNLAGYTIAVVALAARSNRVEDLLPLVPRLLTALQDARPGEVTNVAG